MSFVPVRIRNTSNHPLPQYQTAGAAAFDITANLSKPIVLGAGERTLVPTGLYVAIPEGYELQIRPRSGIAYKAGISLVNTPGTIDSDYRGELGIIMINLSTEDFVINDGDRVAQGVVSACVRAEFVEVDELETTVRGHGGFGHTGTSLTAQPVKPEEPTKPTKPDKPDKPGYQLNYS